MSFRDTCLRNIRISGILLKRGADYGLTLNQIGSLLYRKGYEQSPSVIEEVISRAILMHKTITKSLSVRLKLEKFLTQPKKQRSRAYSTNEADVWRSNDKAAVIESSTSGELDTYELVLTIPENEEFEEEDDDEENRFENND